MRARWFTTVIVVLLLLALAMIGHAASAYVCERGGGELHYVAWRKSYSCEVQP